jgi:trans-aconitate 2-methyltransferase
MTVSNENWGALAFDRIEKKNDEICALIRMRASEKPFAKCLDVGCGNGGLLHHLMQAKLIRTGVGVDLSNPSILVARELNRNCSELQFEQRDITQPGNDELGKFDLVVSESVFHMIDVSDEELASKLATVVESNGYLIFTMPAQCLHNALLFNFRRALRMARGKWLESTMLAIAQYVYRDLDVNRLAQRIPYMFLLPHRVFGRKLSEKFQRAGFKLVGVKKCARESIFKPSHVLAEFQKIGNPL